MPNLILRDARPDEKNKILDLTLSAYQQYAPIMGEHWQEYQDNITATLADPSPAAQIVAEQNGAIVGTALLYPTGTVFHLDDDTDLRLPAPEIRLLAVAPSARGQGIGEALTRECMQRARTAGDRIITLHTTDMMQVAKTMSEKMGFVRAPELDFTPAPDFTIMGYRYNLAP
ncbi:MAG TPA: GNAT family N-acetyltransferase [Anaerolineae bacterium]|nr:GNAT family N-acetyltransferase [Anaerolineae bacterium]